MPDTDALIDPGVTADLADVYGRSGPGPPTLPPSAPPSSPLPSYGAGPIQPAPQDGPPMPDFLGGALSALQRFGQGAGAAWMTATDPLARDRAIAQAEQAAPLLAPKIKAANLLLELTGVPQAQRVGAGLVSPADAPPPIFPGAALTNEAALGARAVAKAVPRAIDAVPGALEGAIGEVAPGAGAFASRQTPRISAARLGPDVPAAQRQIDALRRAGATEQEIADFQKTMNAGRTPGEAMVGPSGERIGMVTTAESEAKAAELTRALQTAAGQEGVPLSQHPIFADYGVSGAKGPKAKASHGGDPGTATRAVMAGDADAIDLLGDRLTNELIQNKIADIVRRTGAPEDVIKRGLGIMVQQEGAHVVDATAEAIVAAGRRSLVGAFIAPGPEYAPLIAAMRGAGATDEDIARYIGTAQLAERIRTPVTETGAAARPGELFPGVRGPARGQAGIITQGEQRAANDAARIEGRPAPYPDIERSLWEGTGAPTPRQPSAQPPFGPERMPGDVQPPRQPPLRSGLAPHMTEAVVDEAGNVVQKPRPVLINGQPVKQVELSPGFGEGEASATRVASEAFPQQPIRATFDPKTGAFTAPVDEAAAVAEQLRIEFPKDALPKTVAVSTAEMVSAVFRNYVVSNALSPFTFAIKAGADVLKMIDTTAEAVSQGVRTKRPGEIPGSVKALYSGFWRGITQDALAAFKTRQYNIGAEGIETKTRVVDRMLSGELGLGAKRFAQKGEVISLGSPVPRSISALTSVFQRGYRDMALYQEGYALASRQGLSGARADQYASAFMARPLEFVGGKAALERATADANTRTWTNSNPLSRIAGRDKPILGDALFTLTPFVNLVTNIAREGTEFIPGVGLVAKGAEALMKGPKNITSQEWTRVVQHQFMGSVGTLVLGQKAAMGEVTGDGPDDDSKRFEMIARGWKPNHTKFGDNWYPNIAFGVLAPLLNFVGNTHDNLVYNTKPQDRDSAISKAGSALNALIKAELDSAHWIDNLMELSSALKGSDAEKQNFVARYLGLFTPQSGSLKAWERSTEPATPLIDPRLSLEDAIAQRYWRQYPPALRPPEYRDMRPGTPRADTRLAATIPYLGTPGTVANYDGVGVAEGSPDFGRNPILIEAQRLGTADPSWRSGGVIEPPSPIMGTGTQQIRLDPGSAQAYVALVGQVRDRIVGAEIHSSDYQDATSTQKQKLYNSALEKADRKAKTQYLATMVLDGDPRERTAQALHGFTTQSSMKDRAYWVWLLDHAGKLTPEITAALNAAKEALPGQRDYPTVAEYLRAAPLVHQYLSHAPYGTDARPIGRPEDWAALEQARERESVRRDALVRSGVQPTLANDRARIEVAQSLTGVQRQLFLSGNLLENPTRRQMTQKYGTLLSRFLGPGHQYTQEPPEALEQFPR